MSGKKSNQDYEDIIRFRPIPILVIKDEKLNQYLWEMHYSLLVRVMREGPMTLKEIQKAYNIQARKEKYNEPKSDTTIYRYVKTLEAEGLITQAGRRVYFDSHKSEFLYSRTARVFYYINLPKSYWESDRGQSLYESIFSAVSKVYDNHELDKNKFNKFLIKFERAKENEIEKLVSKLDDDVLYDITGADWWKIIQVLRYADLFGVLLNQPEILDELKKCFKKEKR